MNRWILAGIVVAALMILFIAFVKDTMTAQPVQAPLQRTSVQVEPAEKTDPELPVPESAPDESSPGQSTQEFARNQVKPPPETEADWERQYGKRSPAELQEAWKETLNEYSARSRPEFEKAIAAGRFEVLSSDATLRAEATDPLELSLVEMLPKSLGGGVRKTVLSKDAHPDIYELKLKLAWLDARLHGIKK